ncbi:hypothetical protein [Aquimarina pacifica]|uniref:hypothetical protein n=1 Tax=Aquimarina pacifica TaxID=1296415 RepID=UPI000472066F|nr:hypothetical protein [Aquimarina pacifica]
MVLETTYANKKNRKLINNLVGSPFTFIQILRLKGIGSKRMIIDDVSPNLKIILNDVSDLNYGNIELRPKGILVAINKGLRNFTWVIPYYQLYVYKTIGMSIHGQGRFVNFRNSKTQKENASFFDKLQRLKIEYDQNHPHIDSI